MSRRILLASYHFPPTAAVGGLRVAKFARIIREFGWQPYVLTVRDDLREDGIDAGRLNGLETVPTVRTAELPRVLEALARVRAPLRRAPVPSPGAAGAGSGALSSRESLGPRLKRYAASLIWHLPDHNKNWALYACGSALNIIRQHQIDWVLTSGPPFSGHVIGLAAKSFTNARWVADFRDPWIDMLEDRDPRLRSSLSDRIERRMEWNVTACADRVVTTTERMREAMRVRYPAISSDRFLVIPNSIDVDRFDATAGAALSSPLTITYTGSLYFDRTPEPLFRALRLLIQTGRAAEHEFRVRLVGECETVDGVATRDLAMRYGLSGSVEISKSVPYAQAVRLMQQSHLLLVLAPRRHRLVIPAKVYDYLGSGSTILGIAEPGATADLISETDAGACFSESDTEGLANHLAAALRHAHSPRKNDPSAFSRYHARHLTERLAAELDRVDAEHAAAAGGRS